MDIDNSNKRLSIVKIIATILFISLPFLGFYIGINYEKTTNTNINEVSEISLKNINNNQSTTTQTIPSPSVSETNNWKTYTNKKYGYSLRYPSSWQMKEYPSWKTSFTALEGNKPAFAIDVFDREVGGQGAPGPLISQEEIIIAGIKADKRIYRGKGMGNNNPESTLVGASINHSGKYYSFEFSFVDSEEKTETFDQILSTFRFTN